MKDKEHTTSFRGQPTPYLREDGKVILRFARTLRATYDGDTLKTCRAGQIRYIRAESIPGVGLFGLRLVRTRTLEHLLREARMQRDEASRLRNDLEVAKARIREAAVLIEELRSGIDSLPEPHRSRAILNCTPSTTKEEP